MGKVHDGIDFHCQFVQSLISHRGQMMDMHHIIEILLRNGFTDRAAIRPSLHKSDNRVGHDIQFCEIENGCNGIFQIKTEFTQSPMIRKPSGNLYIVMDKLFWCDGTIAT